MTHLWVRAEEQPQEACVGILPEGVRALRERGFRVTVEDSPDRAVPSAPYLDAGAERAEAGTWPDAPRDTIIFGVGALRDETGPLVHRHIMATRAYARTPSAQMLLARFRAGGGVLYDLDSLTDDTGHRVASFGYWAGFAGAALCCLAYGALARGGLCAPITRFAGSHAATRAAATALGGIEPPRVLIIGALGRTGRGAAALCEALDLPATCWDRAETAQGGPFPEVLRHEIALICLPPAPHSPVLVPGTVRSDPRSLRVIGDLSGTAGMKTSPIHLNDRPTDWAHPVRRVVGRPPLDVMAITTLPSLLPLEASADFAAQILPHLLALDRLDQGVWARAHDVFQAHV